MQTAAVVPAAAELAVVVLEVGCYVERGTLELHSLFKPLDDMPLTSSIHELIHVVSWRWINGWENYL